MLNQFRVEIMRRPTGRRMSLFDRLFFFIANLGWLFIRTTITLVWGQSQLILIPDLPSPYTISLGNLAIPERYNGKVKLIGPIVDQNTDESGPAIKRRLGFRETRPLVYAAVSGPKVERTILAGLLLGSLKGSSTQYQRVLSKGNPRGGRMPRRVDGVTVYDWIEDQDNFIKASDVIISRAGHGTIMKSLVYGKPMILVPIPDHTEQYGNARRAVSMGVAEMLDQNRLDHNILKSAINEILRNRAYSENSVKIEKTADSMRAIDAACNAISASVRTA
jgi:UDP-N-acetylglucosamine--N-acetylmuramyl-(pentapeptide) pyrophosphoryl-undecaprenol N-acetylglucosamine transferase